MAVVTEMAGASSFTASFADNPDSSLIGSTMVAAVVVDVDSGCVSSCPIFNSSTDSV